MWLNVCFADEEDIRNSPSQFGNYMAGDIKYSKISITMVRLPNWIWYRWVIQPVRKLFMVSVSSGGYKQWDLSFFFQGLARESFWIDTSTDNGTLPFLNGQNALLKAYADDHWSEDNRNLYALWPRLSYEAVENNQKPSTRFMRNGSFLRLKSLEFGYTVPTNVLKKSL